MRFNLGVSLVSKHLIRTSLAIAGVCAAAGSTAAAASARTLYVATTGNNANPCSAGHPCQTINRAVGVAHAGDTIDVSKGTYAQYVVITKKLRLIGLGHPVVDAKGRDNGFIVQGTGGAGTVISGFVVKNAAFEGILLKKTSGVTISGNTIRNNDQGTRASKPVGECAAHGQIPGDCGEGVHLMSVTDSKVTGNLVTGNTGGILLTDELGPTARNLVSKNQVVKNLYDCGITIAAHNPNGVSKTGRRQPKVAGIYGNQILDNVSNNNGGKGEGAGILLATGAGPGSAVYNNLVQGNTANGNGLAGVSLHSHAPGEDLNGNKILNNKLSNDGIQPDPEYGEKGTNGILIGSAVTMLTGIVVKGNTISNTQFGIYTKNVPAISTKSNKFIKVAVPVKQI
jgi:parallel beta-helix repeat protein